MNWFAKSRRRKSKFLRQLGPSWSASPVRRLVQFLCFGLFLTLFFYVAWPYGTGDFAQIRARKEWLDIELFLLLDPLVSISTALAARTWVYALWFAGGILLLGLFLPRAFCAYVCPMGTLIDLFDWAFTRRIKLFQLKHLGWGVANLRYFILAAVLAAALGGLILTGYVSAIPVFTRGMQFLFSPLQADLLQGGNPQPQETWRGVAQLISISLFVLVLLLGLLRARFWCRYLCPTGALFSLANLFRLTQRHVQPHCIECGKCAKVCSFDAINDDFTTKGSNCTFCQTCGGVCPVDAIQFTTRFAPTLTPKVVNLPLLQDSKLETPPAPTVDFSRRNFLISAALGSVGGGLAVSGYHLKSPPQLPPLIRPPGSTPEDTFTRLCVRCDQCLRVCPTGILQPTQLTHGLSRLWTPYANANISGCDPTCNNCGQVCPTGAIQALTLEAKKHTPMGLAVVDPETCLQCQGQTDCLTPEGTGILCQAVCEAAGYSAIMVEDGGQLAPTVLAEQCVGCGLCQAECYRINVREKKLLQSAAIKVTPLQPQGSV